MKGLVLSGGAGTRLRPLTHTTAKQLVPVANTPLIHHGLERLGKAGVTDIGIVTGPHAQAIQDVTGNGSRFGVGLTWISQPEPLGLAHAVHISREFLGNSPFVMYLGDNYLGDDLSEHVSAFLAGDAAARILLARVDDPRAFGVAEVDAYGRVRGVAEKPEHPASDLAIVGVYLFRPEVHEAVAGLKPSPRGELEITDALQWLLDHGHRVDSARLHGYWRDTGSPEDLLDVNRHALRRIEPEVLGDLDADSEITGRVRIEDGARVRCSRITGPAVIGAGARISGSAVGPFVSVGAGVSIDDTHVRDSIVLDGAVLSSVGPVEGSLIGRGARVLRAPDAGHRLLLSDDSEVRIAQ